MEVTVEPTGTPTGTITHSKPTDTTPTGSTTITNTEDQTFTISPETHKYVENKDANGNVISYTITLNLNNVQISNAQMVSATSWMEFPPLRLPDAVTTRTVDFSQKTTDGKPVYDSSLTGFGAYESGSLSGVGYDQNLECFVTQPSTGYQYSGWNHFYNRYIAGDFFSLMEDIGTAPPMMFWYKNDYGDAFDPSNTPINGRHLTGLSRVFIPCNQLEHQSNFNFYNPAAGGKYKLIFGGYTMPVNAALYYGASGGTNHFYEWQSYKTGSATITGAVAGNLIGNTPTAAAQNVTRDACAKLKADYGANIRIYVVKYRKQEKYRHKVSGIETAFDYGYVDACATDAAKVYDVAETGSGETKVTAEENLQKALQTIACDIKTWAGYSNAANVGATGVVNLPLITTLDANGECGGNKIPNPQLTPETMGKYRKHWEQRKRRNRNCRKRSRRAAETTEVTETAETRRRRRRTMETTEATGVPITKL